MQDASRHMGDPNDLGADRATTCYAHDLGAIEPRAEPDLPAAAPGGARDTAIAMSGHLGPEVERRFGRRAIELASLPRGRGLSDPDYDGGSSPDRRLRLGAYGKDRSGGRRQPRGAPEPCRTVIEQGSLGDRLRPRGPSSPPPPGRRIPRDPGPSVARGLRMSAARRVVRSTGPRIISCAARPAGARPASRTARSSSTRCRRAT